MKLQAKLYKGVRNVLQKPLLTQQKTLKLI